MLNQIIDVLANIDEIIASLTILFPGLLAYFIYIGIRSPEFKEIKRSHLILILFSVLFFQILQDISGGLMQNTLYQGIFFFVLPVLMGVAADLSHRIFVTELVERYQTHIINNVGTLGLVDVGNVSRWQKTVKDYVDDGLNDVTKEYYTEVELVSEDGSKIKRGFLNGYSEDDIELIKYNNLSEKNFTKIGTPDLEEDKLTMSVVVIPRDQISSVQIYRVKMEDFVLE